MNDHKKTTSRALILIALLASLLLACSVVTAQQSGSAGAQTQEPSTQAQSGEVTVPAGTKILVRMIDPVNSDSNQVNTQFRGSLEANLMAGDQVAAPKGTIVYTNLLSSQASTSRSGGELELDLTGIMIDNQMHPLASSSISGQGTGGTRAGPGRGAAGGAAAGAAITAVTGPGVIVGTAVGAAAGAVTGAFRRGTARGQNVTVPKDALVEFTLNQPVTLPPSGR